MEEGVDMTSPAAPRVEATTELLQAAIDTVRGLPADAQDEIARAMLAWAHLTDDGEGVEEIDVDLDAGLLESLAQEERGEFASDEEVLALWAKIGL
jgi:hypothetical protein